MAQLGSYLVAGREQAGMSADDVSQVTRIPVKAVEALEQERWNDLPEAAFIRGFVVNYCRTVGLDHGPALQTLSTFSRIRQQPKPRYTSREISSTNIKVNSGHRSAINWTYLTIIIIFTVAVLVAAITMGTGSNDPAPDSNGSPKLNMTVPDTQHQIQMNA